MTRVVFLLTTFASLISFASVSSLKAARPHNLRIPVTVDFMIQAKVPANLIYSARQDQTPFKAVKKYASHWLKEFPKFGFEVEYARASSFANLEGYEFELRDRVSEKRVFQKVAVVDGKALVFTLAEKTADYSIQREHFKDWLAEISIEKIQTQ